MPIFPLVVVIVKLELAVTLPVPGTPVPAVIAFRLPLKLTVPLIVCAPELLIVAVAPSKLTVPPELTAILEPDKMSVEEPVYLSVPVPPTVTTPGVLNVPVLAVKFMVPLMVTLPVIGTVWLVITFKITPDGTALAGTTIVEKLPPLSDAAGKFGWSRVRLPPVALPLVRVSV